ncbi:UDP-N-acetylmuramoyl-L-alanine--D-glutamate ligase [Emcibacter sp.]|uniref:UDP-N-acetylmuramoyl-L-alanine--D-glutamate ligase n=1 Tax=Emcibacter sp. TaxID=1979954 RepID=UPI002AA72F78|nr:UDP-N-acetylmuramoyl-L-alanine--D-glutamate ligase [Emcibacter sp.]
MTLQELERARIAVWGLGKEGHSVLEYLREHFPDKPLTVIADRLGEHLPEGAAFLPEAELLDHTEDFDVIVKSPGISLYRPEVETLKKAGVNITSATNIWFANHKSGHKSGKTIAITGTNGKSTTSALMHHILKSLGKKALLGGNIGVPLLDLEDDADFYVIELSSYQTADLGHAPDIAVLINLFPEHIQWHREHDSYYRDKKRLVEFADSQVVLNHADPLTKKLVHRYNNVHWFNDPNGLHLQGPHLVNGHKVIGLLEEFPLPGRHNRENLCTALAICEVLGLDLKKCFEAAKSFTGLRHRLQKLPKTGSHLYINDSISTTPEASMAALEALAGHKVTLIAGGQDRKQDFTELAKVIERLGLHALITAYETGDRLADTIEAAGADCPVHRVENLEAAVSLARKITPDGGVILLSPAAPSYDGFKNFEERGERFMELASTG